jgi:hypothetical protein
MVRISCQTLLNSLDMAEIDLTNIVSRRTRGKKIDYAKEAAAAGNTLDEDDEEDEEYVRSLALPELTVNF